MEGSWPSSDEWSLDSYYYEHITAFQMEVGDKFVMFPSCHAIFDKKIWATLIIGNKDMKVYMTSD